MRMFVVALMIAPLVAAAPALADAPHAKCLRQNDITDYQALKGGKALIVTDAFRKQYRISFHHGCSGLEHQNGFAIHTFAGNLSCIQRGDQVLVHDFASPPRCFISAIEPYTPEMAAADKAAMAARP